MLYLPLLTFASSLVWAFELWSARLVFAPTAWLHALFGLAALLAARAAAGGNPGSWPRAGRWAWHLGWLLVLLLFNLAAAGNFVARSHWGDPLSFEGMLALLAQETAGAMARDLATARNLLAAAAVVALVLLGGRLFAAAARSRHGRLAGDFAGAHYRKLLAGCLAFGLFAAFYYPGAIQEEPLVAFSGGGSSSSDYRGLAERRAAVRVRDREALLRYDPPSPRPKKNVVLIMADSLRADHFPDYGYHRPLTPFLSKLLEDPRTQRAEWAFSTCSESPCGIGSTLSGHPYQDLSHGVAKIYEYLARAGYDNDLVLTGDHSALSDLGSFYGKLARLEHGEDVGRFCRNSDDRGVLRYLEKLEKFDGRPKFFYFFLMSSHAGGVRLPQFRRYLPDHSNLARARWNNDDAAGMLRSIRRPPAYLDEVVNYYDNGIEQVDWVIGQVIAGLKERGYLEDALVIVTSDHGDSMGEHNHIGHTYRLYNVDMRIPLLIWDSDPSPRPKELPIAAHVSLAPTIFDRLGLPIPATLAAPPLDRAPAEFHSVHLTRRPQQPCAAAIEGTREKLHKLIVCAAGGEPQEELYELIGDPAARRDLLAAGAADPALLAGLREKLGFFYRDILGR
jgi:hypothetical protein